MLIAVVTLLFCWLLSQTQAQTSQPLLLLTIDEALRLGVQNNYDILVARNDAAIASLNNATGAAGILPTIALTAGDNYSLNSIHQQLSNGTEISSSGAGSNSLTAGVALSWTVFDGMKMFATREKLRQIDELGEVQFKQRVLQTKSDIILSYYDVVRQKQQLNAFREIIAYNDERAKISETRFKSGLAPKTDFLQAKVDLNVYKENAISQQTVIAAAKRKLNRLLARDGETLFEVADSIQFETLPDRKQLSEQLYVKNLALAAVRKQTDIALLSISELTAQRYPKVVVGGAYNFVKNNNAAGFTLLSETYGPQFGFTLSMPIFDAGAIGRQVEGAEIQLKTAEYNVQNLKLQINAQLQNAFTDVENQQQLLVLEQENIGLAKENLDVALARLRLGQTNSLEVRQAQLSYENALTRLSTIQYNLKAAETALKQLVAQL